MPRKRHKESFSTLDRANFLLAPLLAIVSWYMYDVTRVDRYAFGPLIGEHVSNFFGSALAMYLATALTTLVEKSSEIREIQHLARFLQVMSAVAILGLNLHFEVWEGNSQMVGDLLSAVMAMSLVWASSRRAFSVLESNSSNLDKTEKDQT